MELLLNFLNVKKWNTESLIELLSDPLKPEQNIYTKYRPEGVPEEKQVVIWRSPVQDKTVLPEVFILDLQGPHGASFFKYLKELQPEWRKRLEDTIKKGPDRMWLTLQLKNDRIYLEETDNPWVLKIDFWQKELLYIERRLLLSYMQPFLNGSGEIYRKIRICKQPSCQNYFVYDRPTKKFCCDKCRLDFHNKKNIDSGYMAEKQRIGRKEKPETYLLK